MARFLTLVMLLAGAGPVLASEPLTYTGTEGAGKGKHLVFLAGDHEYRSEETLPALARILAKHHGFRCTVLFTLDPETGVITPGSSHMPGLEALGEADLMVNFLRFQDFPAEQMQHIVDYLDRAGPVVGLRTATHAFKIPADSQFARFDYQYEGADYERGFGRQVLGESWSGHYGKNHVMSTRLIVIPEARQHPILRGVGTPWVQSGGYWTEPMEDSTVLAMAQPLESMEQDAVPAADKDPCPGAWVRTYEGKSGKKGRVFTSTYGASEDLLNEDYRRLLVNGCFWAVGLEEAIKPDLTVDLVGPYHPVTFGFMAHRPGVKPQELAGWESPLLPPHKKPNPPPRRKR